LIFGSGCAVMAALVAELRVPKLRTPGEAAKATGAPALAAIPRDCTQVMKSEIGAKLWLRWNRERDRDRTGRGIWAPVNDAREEKFWHILLAEARRFTPSLLIIDCGSQPSTALAALPRLADGAGAPALAALRWEIERFTHAEMRDACGSAERHRAAGREVWLRFDGPVQEPASSLARAMGAHPLIVMALDTEPAKFWREQVELMRESVGDPCGVVLLNASPAFAS